jgi:ABC-type Co2+ transport system permease subunit
MDYRSHPMPNQLDGLKIARESRVSLRGFSLAIALATVSALAGSWLSCLHIFYTYGATSANVNTWYAGMGRAAYELLNNRINNPTMTDVPRVLAALVGAGVTALLTALRARFVWWSLHPIGYVVANTFTMDWLWCPTLIGWLAKSLVLRYGGVRLFRTVLPFFIGLVIGDILIAALWTLLFLILNIPGFRTFPI